MNVTLHGKKYYADEKFLVMKNKNFEGEDIHTHDFIELNYTLRGKCIHRIDDTEYMVKKGDLLFINYGENHSFKTEEYIEYYNILIKPDFVSESLAGIENAFALLTLNDFSQFASSINEENRLVNFSDGEQKTIDALTELMLREQEGASCGQSLVLRSALNVLLTMIFRKMSLPMSERLYIDQSLLSYIQDNCGNSLKMNQIAEKCFYNPSYFSRSFKKFTGMSFSDYLLKCRIERACRLLESTDMKIETVMTESGFSDRTKFFRHFADATGLTPLQFRKSKK